MKPRPPLSTLLPYTTLFRSDVTIYDISNERLAELDMFFSSQIKTAYASRSAIANAVKEAELVIGAVLVPGAAAPKLVTREIDRKSTRLNSSHSSSSYAVFCL